MRELGTATHGVFRIFIKRGEFDGVGADPGEAYYQKQHAGCKETAESTAPVTELAEAADFFQKYSQKHVQRIYHDHYRQIVGDLLVIGLDLETQGETEQDGSEQGFRKPGFPTFCRFDRLGDRAVRSLSLPNGRTKPWPKRRAVCENHSRKRPRQERDRLHLGVVPDLDDLEVVRAIRDGDSPSNSKNLVHTQREHQQKGSQQGDEQPVSRPLSFHQKTVQRLCPVPIAGRNERSGRHPAEHGVRPVSRVVRMSVVPCHSLLRHASVAGDVALVDNLAGQHLRHKAIGENQKQQHNPGIYSNLLHQSLVHNL